VFWLLGDKMRGRSQRTSLPSSKCGCTSCHLPMTCFNYKEYSRIQVHVSHIVPENILYIRSLQTLRSFKTCLVILATSSVYCSLKPLVHDTCMAGYYTGLVRYNSTKSRLSTWCITPTSNAWSICKSFINMGYINWYCNLPLYGVGLRLDIMFFN